MAFGFKPKGSRNIDPEHSKVDREAKPEVKPKTMKNWKAKGEGFKPEGSRHVPKDQM